MKDNGIPFPVCYLIPPCLLILNPILLAPLNRLPPIGVVVPGVPLILKPQPPHLVLEAAEGAAAGDGGGQAFLRGADSASTKASMVS